MDIVESVRELVQKRRNLIDVIVGIEAGDNYPICFVETMKRLLDIINSIFSDGIVIPC
ncbi:hypothetical protein QUF84_15075 [Fictibacillus enclensis]|nr:hypothetical protein [Fictibacillus enclensis]